MNTVDEAIADDNATLALAPGVIVRPSLTNPGLLEIAWGGGSSREYFTIDSPAVARWLLGLPSAIPKDKLIENASDKLGLDTDNAAAIVSTFVSYGLLQPPVHQSDGERRWQAIGWDDALAFHRSVQGMRWRLEYPEGADVYTWYQNDKLVRAEQPRPPVLDERHPAEISLPLPTLRVPRADLREAMLRRRTTRNFSDTTIDYNDIADVLYWSFKPIVPAPYPRYYTTRAVSEGGRGTEAPTFLSVFALFDPRVTHDIPISERTGSIFRYSPARHALAPVRNSNADYLPFRKILWGQTFADEAPIVLVLTVNWKQYMWKYRSSAFYRMVHYDLGAFMQTVVLVATAIGLRTFITPAVDDERIERLLDVEQDQKGPAYVVALGRGDSHELSARQQRG